MRSETKKSVLEKCTELKNELKDWSGEWGPDRRLIGGEEGSRRARLLRWARMDAERRHRGRCRRSDARLRLALGVGKAVRGVGSTSAPDSTPLARGMRSPQVVRRCPEDR